MDKHANIKFAWNSQSCVNVVTSENFLSQSYIKEQQKMFEQVLIYTNLSPLLTLFIPPAGKKGVLVKQSVTFIL